MKTFDEFCKENGCSSSVEIGRIEYESIQREAEVHGWKLGVQFSLDTINQMRSSNPYSLLSPSLRNVTGVLTKAAKKGMP